MNIHNRVPWINLVVGILTIISPYALGTPDYAAKWSLTITGIVIGIVAIIELSMDNQNNGVAYWPVVNIIAGIWLLVSTYLATGTTAMVWSNIVLGVTAIVTAIVAISYERLHARNGNDVDVTRRV